MEQFIKSSIEAALESASIKQDLKQDIRFDIEPDGVSIRIRNGENWAMLDLLTYQEIQRSQDLLKNKVREAQRILSTQV